MFGWLKKSTVYSLDQLGQLAEFIGYRTASGTAVTELTAVDVPALFCGARVIAEGCAQVPVRVLHDDRTGLHRNSKVMWDHWAHRLLAVRPNGWQTSFEFREGMILNAVIGRGAIAIKNVVHGEVKELLPVPSGSWGVEQVSDYSLRIRVDYADKTHGYFDLGQVFYLRGPSLNGYEALPVFRLAREAIGLSKALEKQQAQLAGNGGKPSGVLSGLSPLNPEAKEKLRTTWQERFGPNGEGGIAVLDGEAKFSSMTMTSVDAQYIETRRLQIEEIGRALRVQPIMMMQADKAATFASAEQMFRNHVIHTLGPWYRRFEEAANRDVLGNDPDLRVDLDERGLLRGDFADQAEYYSKALGSGGGQGWMSTNEIRAERDMNPIEDDWANKVPRGAMEQDHGTQADTV